LAGEANAPGSFSKRTVNFLATLDKDDAVLFTKLCSFNWSLAAGVYPLVYDYDHEIYLKNAINFAILTHLDTIGLVDFASLQGFVIQEQPKKITAVYNGTHISLELPQNEKNKFKIGKVVLTHVGQELASICRPDIINGYFEYILNEWTKDGLKPASPYVRHGFD
jgi:hypothetical protein